ncbi:hypothetical protein B0H13DRAFT_1903125 [Mycena leptocephala]|nr:hypothetical protein B0H13DRAFT_1903125 [Mycena leptocephala]
MASDSSNILSVSVVGAGIAGLSAAIALRRNGHHVQIFEKTESKREIGAALGVPLNALRVLDHLGILRENLKGVPWSGGVVFDAESGEEVEKRSWSASGTTQMIGLLCHRSDLYEELKRLATGDGEGAPATMRLGAKVMACDPEEGTISLISGEVVRADLILGEVQKASPSAVSCFRAVFQLREGPELQWYTGGVSGTRTVIAKEGPFRMLIMYPCRSGTLLNFVAVFTDSHEEGWKPTASREEIRAKLKSMDSSVCMDGNNCIVRMK